MVDLALKGLGFSTVGLVKPLGALLSQQVLGTP